jgi:hypothetical protein
MANGPAAAVKVGHAAPDARAAPIRLSASSPLPWTLGVARPQHHGSSGNAFAAAAAHVRQRELCHLTWPVFLDEPVYRERGEAPTVVALEHPDRAQGRELQARQLPFGSLPPT